MILALTDISNLPANTVCCTLSTFGAFPNQGISAVGTLYKLNHVGEISSLRMSEKRNVNVANNLSGPVPS